MRLIDADALYEAFERTPWRDNADRDKAEELADNAPTISPVPDPITGLVPCGCGGKAKVWCGGPAVPTQFTPVVSVYEVACTECAMTTNWVRGKQENAMKAWNTAMGWKGDAE